jgi:hypothetical protein
MTVESVANWQNVPASVKMRKWHRASLAGQTKKCILFSRIEPEAILLYTSQKAHNIFSLKRMEMSEGGGIDKENTPKTVRPAEPGRGWVKRECGWLLISCQRAGWVQVVYLVSERVVRHTQYTAVLLLLAAATTMSSRGKSEVNTATVRVHVIPVLSCENRKGASSQHLDFLHNI